MEHEDAMLWEALRRAHLVDNGPHGEKGGSRFTLETPIDPEGAKSQRRGT